MVHGCVGPAFFALCVVAAVVTSRHWWLEPSVEDVSQPRIGLLILMIAVALVIVSYGQLVLGAVLRHVQPAASPGGFALTVVLHVAIAFLLWILTLAGWLGLRRCGDLTLSRPGAALIGLVGLQILLGVGTWVVNYGWPSFLSWVPGARGYLLVSKGFIDSIVVTAHAATGALILAVSTLVLVRLLRVRDRRLHAQPMRPGLQQDASSAAHPSPTAS
jgi:cytochrome c oxidase assembly protein subunit 15